ncbi:MAG: KOW domain-containing RNA-binding protein [Dethiobacteria bacterium]|jgi:ribosomal protein L14E/L6E/L27E|nr:KOW domain-containing RNA-binding protein [Bacillota bacterium]NMD34076.1 RNA-binding protein [Bacillota bacterium]HOB29118.1 KOW domain-containing RNA-binding protein [Bacillota bacterium]HPZ41690.1 KOW domain-containing RNA-binding protein [Bacillota bacterium]HQD52256.1 KOW domain-containing RNA-binding protein [Bacillota bacterium]
MEELRPGQLVRSRAGRDKGSHYLVIRVISPREVLLSDGRRRPLSRPKKKNVAHLQPYSRRVEIEELVNSQKLTDSQVIKYLCELAPQEEEA